MNKPIVLAITKRTAELCDTRSLLHSAGFNLVTATNLAVARSVIEAIRLKGVIICRESWSEHERESIVSEIAVNHPEVTVMLRCPGWKRCVDCGGRSDMKAVSLGGARWVEPEWAGTPLRWSSLLLDENSV